MARYSEADLTIDFDNFVGCLVRLETMFSESLQSSSRDGDNDDDDNDDGDISFPQTHSTLWTQTIQEPSSSTSWRYEAALS